MYDDDDLLPVSALQHLVFCPRQCALIHVEMQWAENRLTAEGRALHERADSGLVEVRGDLLTARGLLLRSRRLGLTGRADIVEFHRCTTGEGAREGVRLPRRGGRWTVMPVEYKRGRPKPDLSDKVQLCAQAICLEEMLDTAIPEAALYYGKERRRLDVSLDVELRAETARLAQQLHALLESGAVPQAEYAPKCDNCSLYGLCQPKALGRGGKAARYIAELFTGKETQSP